MPDIPSVPPGKSWVWTLLALAIFLSLPAASLAGEEPVPDEEATDARATFAEEVLVEDEIPYVSDVASSATKSPTPVELLPMSVSVVTTPLLRDQNARLLGEALENVAGVNIHTNAGVHDFFFIRGYDSLSSGMVMTDGALEPEATFYQTYNLERIEVIRGPGGFLYGGNPLAGLVNLIRKRPASGVFTRVGAFVGTHSTAFGTLDFNVGDAGGARGMRLNAMWQDSDGHRDANPSTVLAVNPTYAARVGRRTTLTANLEAVRSDYTPDLGLPLVFNRQLPAVPAERSYQTPFDFSDQEIVRFRLDVESHLGSRLSLHSKTYVTLFDWATKGSLLNGAFPDGTGGFTVFRNRTFLDDRQELVGHQLDLRLTLGSGEVRHRLLAGVEVQRLTDDFTLDVGLLPGIDLFDPVETAPAQDFFIPQLGTAAAVESVVVAPYLLDEIEAGDRWRFYLGGRLDRLDVEDSTVGFSNTDSQLSPWLGVLYAPDERSSLYASYSEAFSPPSSTVAGQGRRPEEGRQLELGWKRAFLGGRLHTALALYRLEKENLAIVDDNGFTTQQGDQASDGLELEITSSPRPGLHWILSYAFTDAELTRFAEAVIVSQQPFRQIVVDRSGNTPAFAPRHLAKLWISRRFPSGLGLAGGARFVDDQFIAEDNLFTIDSHLLVDAHISYQWARLRASLHLQNLTDERTFGRGFGTGSVLPVDGFNVLGGVHFDL